jgi:cyclopropane fatty-acyl-phospholipid synthase-like methyltransferase
MSTDKPYAPACERNREPILSVLRTYFADRHDVLEIGSGTGQHAVHFAGALPQLRWQTSERAEHHDGIRAWLAEAALPNVAPPIALDVAADAWPARGFDAAFTANTLHIMSWAEVEATFAGLDAALEQDATLVVYGPFNYGGKFTSASNADFDQWLKARGTHMGIRDFGAVDALARGIGLRLIDDVAMPAHNRCLIWRRTR